MFSVLSPFVFVLCFTLVSGFRSQYSSSHLCLCIPCDPSCSPPDYPVHQYTALQQTSWSLVALNWTDYLTYPFCLLLTLLMYSIGLIADLLSLSLPDPSLPWLNWLLSVLTSDHFLTFLCPAYEVWFVSHQHKQPEYNNYLPELFCTWRYLFINFPFTLLESESRFEVCCLKTCLIDWLHECKKQGIKKADALPLLSIE